MCVPALHNRKIAGHNPANTSGQGVAHCTTPGGSNAVYVKGIGWASQVTTPTIIIYSILIIWVHTDIHWRGQCTVQ